MDTGELNELMQAVLQLADFQYAPMSGSESDGDTGAEDGSDSEHPDAPGTPGGVGMMWRAVRLQSGMWHRLMWHRLRREAIQSWKRAETRRLLRWCRRR
jgi:hypothetical protein